MKIISRKEAKVLGLKRYFTGKPCKRGHISDLRVVGGCVECARRRDQDLRNKNPEKLAEYRTRWRKSNADRCRDNGNVWKRANTNVTRDWRLRTLYGITSEDYNKMLVGQDYKCAICRISQDDLKKKLAVDHCHDSGKIRGLLCSNCNQGIGKFYDNSIMLQRATNYLKMHEENN